MDSNLKIEILKIEDGTVFESLDDDLIEYEDDGEFVEYEYVEESEKSGPKLLAFKYEDRTMAIKRDMDNLLNENKIVDYKCSNRACKRDNLSFDLPTDLEAHNEIHVNQINKNVCPICNKSLASLPKLLNHMETRHIPKSFQCDNCGKIFRSKDNLRLHMSHHRKHFLVECRACKKTYKSMQSLRYHLRQHFEHHQCETCGKVFEHKKLLIGHVAAKHNLDLMVPCRFCSRMFSRTDVREAHEREIHKNGEVGSHFKCNQCDEAFDLREDLMRHKIIHHYTGQIHTCTECGKIFKKKSLMQLHMNCHLEKSIQCDVCKMMFTFVTGLAKHKKLGRCKGPSAKSFKEINTKEEIARIAKQQLMDITVNPIIKRETDVFVDFMDEENVKKFPACKKESKKPGRKPKTAVKYTTVIDKKNAEVVSNLYQSKPAVTIRQLTTQEIEQQQQPETVDEILTSSSGRVIKRKLPMALTQYTMTRPVSIPKKSNVPYECDVCGENLESKSKLMLHFSSHRHSRKVHQCLKCDRPFLNLVALRKHCAKDHPDTNPFKEKRFQCDLCPKKYLTDFLLGQHKLSHEDKKSQKCPECPFATNAPYDLKNHIKRIHYATKDFMCPEENCGKSFKRRCDMENHRKSVHSKIRIYVKCPTCDVIVLEKGLQSHMINRHTEKAVNKPFVCGICGKAERYEKNLQRHYESVHEPQSRGIIYPCPECPEMFYRRRDLSAHSFVHFNGQVHNCEECGNKYKSKKDLTNHMYSHRCKEYPCPVCKVVFQTKSGRSKHMRKHNGAEAELEEITNIEIVEPLELFID